MMDFIKVVIQFLKDNYMFITLGFSGVIFLLEVILCFKKSKSLLPVYALIKDVLPGVVKLAEETSLKGDEKLSFAVDLVKGYLVKAYPKLSPDTYTRYIVEKIEEILSTPQKKGV